MEDDTDLGSFRVPFNQFLPFRRAANAHLRALPNFTECVAVGGDVQKPTVSTNKDYIMKMCKKFAQEADETTLPSTSRTTHSPNSVGCRSYLVKKYVLEICMGGTSGNESAQLGENLCPA